MDDHDDDEDDLVSNRGNPIPSKWQHAREVPWSVFGHLRAGYVDYWAHQTLRHLRDHGGYEPGQSYLSIPDSFGTVVTWLWEVSKNDEAAILVADYMSSLRTWDDLAINADGPRVRLEDVLLNLSLALPPGTDADRLIQYLRDNVPEYYGDDDLNA